MRVLCYLNQFYGQIGGEAEAGYPMTVEQKPIGPCLALMLELKDTACECVATVICGDNYFAENTEACLDQFARILDEYHPDVVIAGPAFNAGRYGIACGQILKACFDKGIPAASGMYEENPGVLLYKKYGYIFPAAPNARGMRKSIQTFAAFLRKFSSGEEIGGPAEEGYFPREIRKNKWYTQTGAERAVNMLMKKVSGLPFQTELKMPAFTSVTPSAPIRDMKHATIAVMTSGGIVPTGNPDRLEALACTKYKAYSIDELGGEELGQVDVAHGGYDRLTPSTTATGYCLSMR